MLLFQSRYTIGSVLIKSFTTNHHIAVQKLWYQKQKFIRQAIQLQGLHQEVTTCSVCLVDLSSLFIEI